MVIGKQNHSRDHQRPYAPPADDHRPEHVGEIVPSEAVHGSATRYYRAALPRRSARAHLDGRRLIHMIAERGCTALPAATFLRPESPRRLRTTAMPPPTFSRLVRRGAPV